jgi:hypothetical protein
MDFVLQGFFTAVRQEAGRQHVSRGEAWSFDDVVLSAEVTDVDKVEQLRLPQKFNGVAVQGLFLEGASWSRADRYVTTDCCTCPVWCCQCVQSCCRVRAGAWLSPTPSSYCFQCRLC